MRASGSCPSWPRSRRALAAASSTRPPALSLHGCQLCALKKLRRAACTRPCTQLGSVSGWCDMGMQALCALPLGSRRQCGVPHVQGPEPCQRPVTREGWRCMRGSGALADHSSLWPQVVVFALGAGSVPAHTRALVAAFERIHAELPDCARAAAARGAGGGAPPGAAEAKGPAGGSRAGHRAAAAPAGGEPPGAPRGAGGEAAAGRTSSRIPVACEAGLEAGSAGPRGSNGAAAPPTGSTLAVPDSSATPDARFGNGGAAQTRARPAGMSPREAFFAAAERCARAPRGT